MEHLGKGIMWYVRNDVPLFKKSNSKRARSIPFITSEEGARQLQKALDQWEKEIK